MEQDELKEKMRPLFIELLNEYLKEMVPAEKKFTIEYLHHTGINNEQVMETVDVDYWFEDLIQSQFIIVGVDSENDRAITIPSAHMRSIWQNFGFNEDFAEYQKAKEKAKRNVGKQLSTHLENVNKDVT